MLPQKPIGLKPLSIQKQDKPEKCQHAERMRISSLKINCALEQKTNDTL
jgi:hypothetical protein